MTIGMATTSLDARVFQKLLLPLITCKVLPSMNRELPLRLSLMMRWEILLELSMQTLCKLVVLTGMQCDLMNEPLGKLLWCGRVW
jgi:hypothetical protein